MSSLVPAQGRADEATAQPESATETATTDLESGDDEARAAFREGTEAAERERWADSERAFRKAYGLSRAPSALFNQAVALRALGKHLEARNAFDELLTSTDPQVSADLRQSAESLRAESASRVAVLSLTGLTLSPHRIRVDGKVVPDTLARPLTIELDEGPHSLEIMREGHEPWLATQELLPGEQRSLAVLLVSQHKEPPATARRRKIAYWLGGAALVLTAGAVTTTLWVMQRDRDEPLEPRAGTVFEVP